ncbi:MinD/ParA family protein [Candidatus Sumerlaeota bacterium]|nr:MinD/ParA family protein [Candidatus Sumerlaeota bacterium]
MDQANTLRTLYENQDGLAPNVSNMRTRVFSFTSGKGGVGKTSIVSNLAIELTRSGNRVMIFDADLGLANIDVMLGLNCRYNLTHLLNGEMRLNDILAKGPEGILILPASSGVEEMVNLTDEQKNVLLSEMEAVGSQIDYLLIDTSAGINGNVMYFNTSAHETMIVVTPEPTSITDAYALIKVMSQNYQHKRFQILINQAQNETSALDVYKNLLTVSDRYLSVSLNYLGHIPHDPQLKRCVMRQKAAVAAAPESPFSKAIRALSERVQGLMIQPHATGNAVFFWRTMFESQTA